MSFKLNNCYDYEDIEFKGIRDIADLFNGEDYYKPIKAKRAFNGSYIEYESKGGKNKILSPKGYLDMIRQ